MVKVNGARERMGVHSPGAQKEPSEGAAAHLPAGGQLVIELEPLEPVPKSEPVEETEEPE